MVVVNSTHGSMTVIIIVVMVALVTVLICIAAAIAVRRRKKRGDAPPPTVITIPSGVTWNTGSTTPTVVLSPNPSTSNATSSGVLNPSVLTDGPFILPQEGHKLQEAEARDNSQNESLPPRYTTQ